MAEKYLGESIKNLGFGLMRLPMLGDEIDIEQTKRMVDTFMAKGFTYFDTAWRTAAPWTWTWGRRRPMCTSAAKARWL